MAYRLAGRYDYPQDNPFQPTFHFEPLLERIEVDLSGIDWIIIGAQTGQRALKPKFEWVEAIINSADNNGTPVFIKDNLKYIGFTQQQFPYSLL